MKPQANYIISPYYGENVILPVLVPNWKRFERTTIITLLDTQVVTYQQMLTKKCQTFVQKKPKLAYFYCIFGKLLSIGQK